MYTKTFVKERISYFKQEAKKLAQHLESNDAVSEVIRQELDNCNRKIDMWEEELEILEEQLTLLSLKVSDKLRLCQIIFFDVF